VESDTGRKNHQPLGLIMVTPTPSPDFISSYLITFKPYLHQYGYWAVLAGILGENFGLPLPGETLLIAAAVLASQGDLNIITLLLFAWTGAVIGDNIGYAIGRFAGQRLLLRYGYYVGITEARLEWVHGFFQRFGGGIVIAARFFELLRQLNGIAAGVSTMSWWRFLLYNSLGAALWVGFWGILAFSLGSHLTEYLMLFKRFEVYLVVALLIAAAFGLYRLWRQTSSAKDKPPG
jgi:membrane protein DedA with SNARE-associated domain